MADENKNWEMRFDKTDSYATVRVWRDMYVVVNIHNSERYLSQDALESAKAQGRLIAAAPELLEACESALKLLNKVDLGNSACADKLHLAIEKAKGENL